MTEGLLAPTGRSADVIRAIDAPFYAQDPDHLEACRQLWHAAWPEVEYAGLVHGGWTRLGFPTGDLVKDLTAISLVHHLLNLAKFAPAMFASALEADAPLSTASAAVCLLLRGFLRLHAPGAVPQPIGGCGTLTRPAVASDETRRRFLSWGEARSDAFDALQLEYTVHLLTTWRKLDKQMALMDFPKALVQTRQQIESMVPRIEAGVCYAMKTRSVVTGAPSREVLV